MVCNCRMCVFSCRSILVSVFLFLQNGMRKKYPSEEGTGLYVFVADDYMALPDDTELSIARSFIIEAILKNMRNKNSEHIPPYR